MLAQAPVIGFIPVQDFNIAESFYSGKLGLKVAARDSFALVLTAANGMMIRCVQIPGNKPQLFTILGWEVSDIATVAKQLKVREIEPILYPHFEQDENGIWTAPGGGARVLWFQDPFGNVLSLSQHPAADV